MLVIQLVPGSDELVAEPREVVVESRQEHVVVVLQLV
jgi:hypothetical protein